jgi:hypothetical protein
MNCIPCSARAGRVHAVHPGGGAHLLAGGDHLLDHLLVRFVRGHRAVLGPHTRPEIARADGLNRDLMNDGSGNPKNTESMLLAHRTPLLGLGGLVSPVAVGGAPC